MTLLLRYVLMHISHPLEHKERHGERPHRYRELCPFHQQSLRRLQEPENSLSCSWRKGTCYSSRSENASQSSLHSRLSSWGNQDERVPNKCSWTSFSIPSTSTSLCLHPCFSVQCSRSAWVSSSDYVSSSTYLFSCDSARLFSSAHCYSARLSPSAHCYSTCLSPLSPLLLNLTFLLNLFIAVILFLLSTFLPMLFLNKSHLFVKWLVEFFLISLLCLFQAICFFFYFNIMTIPSLIICFVFKRIQQNTLLQLYPFLSSLHFQIHF